MKYVTKSSEIIVSCTIHGSYYMKQIGDRRPYCDACKQVEDAKKAGESIYDPYNTKGKRNERE